MTKNNIFKETDDYFSSKENLGFNFDDLFTPEYFYINNKIIYEKNNEPREEVAWTTLSDIIKKIQKKISNSKSQVFNNDNITLINKLMQPYNKPLSLIQFHEIQKKTYQKSELIILLNYLMHTNIKNNLSYIIIYLFRKIYNEIKINESMKEINYKDFRRLNIDIYILSKLKFNNLQLINLQNCGIDEQIIKDIQNIFTSKLTYLNISENKLTNLQIFNKENIFNNLIYLDLSHNNIEEINSLMFCKFSNLKKLNLSHNKISNIKCLDNDLNFNHLEELDLSFNNIKELNQINIPSLILITLTNNPISEGIINFFNYDKLAGELVIENNNNNELYFDYSKFDQLYNKFIQKISFTYIIENKDKNNLLQKVKFNTINKLVIKGFENINFLINDTLDALIELHLKDNSINDISIFNDVKLNKLKKLLVKDNIYFIKKVFNFFNKFNNINYNLIYITRNDNKYKCKIIYNSINEINFIFDNLEFLKEELFLKFKKIELEQSIWDNNINFFFEAIQNISSYPLFKNKPKALTIKYKNSKYEVFCQENEYFSYLKMHFILNDLNIFNIEFFDSVKEIDFIGVKFNDNINLSPKVMPKLKKIILKKNIIESIKIISVINELRRDKEIVSDFLNKCNNKLLELLNEKFYFHKIENCKENENDVVISYRYPFNFYTYLNKRKLNELRSFQLCEEITLNNLELNDDDINFLKHDTLLNLKRLSLNNNTITNLKFLDKIKSQKLYYVKIQKNLINEGAKYIEENIKSQKLYDIEIKRKPYNENILILSLSYKGNYKLYFDIFYDTNKNLEILKQINLGNIFSLDLSNLDLNNIDFYQINLC